VLRTTPQERQALGVTALLLVAGAGVRIFSLPEGEVEWEGGASDTLVVNGLGGVRADAEAELERERVRGQPLAPGERIDPNRADALQLDRLPKVGPALAERIVDWREERGPFRSLADLDSVPGVGPALLESLEAHLRLPAASRGSGSAAGATRAEAGGARREAVRAGAAGQLDLNRATAGELEALPGIGPALAARIVALRAEEGPFRSVDDLDGVPGIGPALLERIRPLVNVPP
jgi:competence ComEA-like helix-hairpin-helix protein